MAAKHAKALKHTMHVCVFYCVAKDFLKLLKKLRSLVARSSYLM